jgi:hypothetical protein
MQRTGRREWAKRIREWKRSGQAGASFAAGLGVKEGTLRHWRWQLNHWAKAARARKKAEAGRRRSGSREPAAGFVELTGAQLLGAGPMVEVAGADGFRVTIRLSAGAEVDVVGLVQALRRHSR